MAGEQGSLSEQRKRALEAIVKESVLEWVAGLGSRLGVTPTRVVVVRDGAERRPRTGLRGWAHGDVDARLDAPRGGHGRIVLWTGANPTAGISIIVPATDWRSAIKTVERIRAEARKARAGSRRPPIPRRESPPML